MNRINIQQITEALTAAGHGRPVTEHGNQTIYPVPFRRYWPSPDRPDRLDLFLGAVPPGASPSVYVHVPFCSRKCRFCVYYSVRDPGNLAESYVEAVEREFALAASHLGKGRTSSKVYFGGGTPTALSNDQLGRVFAALRDTVTLASGGYSWTVETSPQQVDADRLGYLAGEGVNVICMGVQSFDDEVLKAIGRDHDSATAVRAVEEVLKHDFELLNVDLIYGLPGQSADKWESTVRKGIELGIPEFSLYVLRADSETSLEKGESYFVGEVEKFGRAAELFGEHDYVRTRPHHFVHKNSLAAWQRLRSIATPEEGTGAGEAPPLALGFGPSAFGRTGDCFYSNTSDLAEYGRNLGDDVLPVERMYSLGPEDHAARYLIGRLGQKGELDIADYVARFGMPSGELVTALSLFAELGLVEVGGEGEKFAVSDTGTLFFDCLERACYPRRWRRVLWGAK